MRYNSQKRRQSEKVVSEFTTKRTGILRKIIIALLLIFSTNSKARWSLYTGFGASLGVSINAKTDIYYSKNKFSETMFQNGNLIYENTRNDGDEYETETFRNKTNIGLSAYVPLGIDFRIGKKNEFWKRAHLYYELRPGLNMTTIPELRTIINPGIQYGLGFRFSIK